MKEFKSPGSRTSPPTCSTFASPMALEYSISVATCCWSCTAKASSPTTRLKLCPLLNHLSQKRLPTTAHGS
eukprot:2255476-Alexandrium_andersonii.AAC.1